MKLKFLFPLTGFILLCFFIGIQYVSLHYELVEHEYLHAKDILRAKANSLQSSTNSFYAQKNTIAINRYIEETSLISATRHIYVLNENDIIIHTNDLSYIGSHADHIVNAIQKKDRQDIRTKTIGRILTNKNENWLTAVYPLNLSNDPNSIHMRKIGLLVIEYDIKPEIQKINYSVIKSIGYSSFAVLFLVLIAICILHILLTKKVAKILHAAHLYQNGQRQTRIQLSGKDEFHQISQAFNDMADSAEQAEKEIRDKEISLEKAQKIAKIGNWVWDIQSGSLFWSDEIYRIFGFKPQKFDVTYEKFIELIHPHDREKVIGAVQTALEQHSEYRVNHRIILPNNTIRMVQEIGEIEVDKFNKPFIMNGTIHDITETYNAQQEVKNLNKTLEKRVYRRTMELQNKIAEKEIAEEKYRQSEKWARQIVDSAVDGIITTNIAGEILTFNHAAEKIFKYSAQEVIGKNVALLMPMKDAQAHDQYISNYLESNTAKIIGIGREVVGLRATHEKFDMDLSISEFIQDGEKTFVGIIRDLTERKELEKQLRTKDSLLRDAVKNIPGAIIFLDQKDNIIFANHKLFEWYDIPISLFEKENSFYELLTYVAKHKSLGDGDPHDLAQKHLDKFFKNPHHAIQEFTFPDLRIGEFRCAKATENSYIVVITDITERKNADKELRQTQESLIEAEKMASLGGLVAGVAHEINTPVGISVTAASHLMNKTSEIESLFQSGNIKKSELVAYLEQAKHSSTIVLSNLERASTLIHGFKKIAVDQSHEEIRDFNLLNYINEVLLSLYPQLKKTNITVDVNCPKDLVITSYPGAISQILSNLIINACLHAFPNQEKGQITLTITQKDHTVILIHQDNGVGMPPETVQRIFEPFYTTKRGKGGSGLGMHIIYNIVAKSLQGTIKCESQENEGSIFTVSFPLSITKERLN